MQSEKIASLMHLEANVHGFLTQVYVRNNCWWKARVITLLYFSKAWKISQPHSRYWGSPVTTQSMKMDSTASGRNILYGTPCTGSRADFTNATNSGDRPVAHAQGCHGQACKFLYPANSSCKVGSK